MKQFFKYVLATFVGLLIFTIISFLILIAIGIIVSSKKEVEIAENSVLKLKLNKPIVERDIDDPFSDLDLPFKSSPGGIGLRELTEALANAKLDDKIKGIYLELKSVPASFASLEEIRNSLLDFKSSGKFITAYGEVYSEGAYYLASVADKIFLNPVGLLEFNGLNAELWFFKGSFEKLEIVPEIFKVGDYKSAVEPLIRENMSEPNRIQVTSFLNSLYDHYLKNVSESRGIKLSTLENISDAMLIHSADDALKLGLITDIAYYDEVLDSIKKDLGLEKDEKVKFVSLKKYKSAEKIIKVVSSKNKIAVIFASGSIQLGKGDDDVIGSDKIAGEIRKARLDKKVKAVVLRVNSPGGDALASDIIWREVVLTSKVKPIIASMSDVAASGGYYISMGCDTIVAQPNTITGSIGVFGLWFNGKNFLKNKLGITVDGVKTGNFSDIGTFSRPVTDLERAIIQGEVDRIYEDFTSKAAQGRGLSVDSLKKLAGGRVWSGVEALNNGLIDVLGGLDDAIKIAAKAADIEDDYKIKYLPPKKKFFDELLSGLKDETRIRILQQQLGDLYPYVKSLQELQKMKGVQARMFELKIEY